MIDNALLFHAEWVPLHGPRQGTKQNEIFKKSHISRRTKLCFILFTFLWVFCPSWGSQSIQLSQQGSEPLQMEKYVVQPGDTLWQIAQIGQYHQNPFNGLHTIEAYNHLSDNANIYPGQVLWIPKDHTGRLN